jgi:HD-like signal output (HDOD) protein
LSSEATQKIVAQVGALPSLPSTLTAVDAALAEEDCSLDRVAEVMSSDVAMVAPAQLGDVVRVADHLVGSIETDEGYLERVGLLANVRLYNQGFLRLR